MIVTVADIVKHLGLTVVTKRASLAATISGGYTADLLSCVMAKAQPGNLWVTLQAHPNVIAVASLLNLSGVVITEGNSVDQPTIEKADQEGIPLLTTPLTSYSVVEHLSALGIHGIDYTS